jgi:formate dehydrogenase (NADP+) beta subunit
LLSEEIEEAKEEGIEIYNSRTFVKVEEIELSPKGLVNIDDS